MRIDGGKKMLNKEELNYLVMLVTIDQRKVVRAYKNNNQQEEANKQKDIRQSLINKLNAMYDALDK